MAGVMTKMTPKDLYALVLAETGGADPLWGQLGATHRWVMDLESYREVRAACLAAGAVYPEGDDPEKWVPDPGDQLFAIPVEVRDGGGAPHLERLA